MIIEEDLYDHEFCEKYTHGFKELAEHVHKFTPEWAEPITWVPADKIRAAARLFATVKPAMLEWGCAIEHTPNTIQTIRALSMIPAITGNIDVPGGWIFGMKGAGRFPSLIENLDPEVEKKRLGYEKYKMLCGEGADLPACHIPTLIDAMLTGVPYRVGAFLVFGNNTLTTYANTNMVYKALMKLDFMVCADLFMTPTAELADIVLPAASWPELNQICALPTIAGNVVMSNQQVVRMGECKSDEEIFVELARRMKLPVCTEAVEDVLDQMLKNGRQTVDFKGLTEQGWIHVQQEYRKYEKRGFKTPTGKLELYSTRLEAMGYAPLPYYEEPPESPLSTPEVAGRLSVGPDDGRTHSDLLQLGAPAAAAVPQGPPRSALRHPPGHGGRARDRGRRMDGHRDAPRPHQTDRERDDQDRCARDPLRARLVVPGEGRPRLRNLGVERQPSDGQSRAVRSADGHVPAARAFVPRREAHAGERPLRASGAGSGDGDCLAAGPNAPSSGSFGHGFFGRRLARLSAFGFVRAGHGVEHRVLARLLKLLERFAAHGSIDVLIRRADRRAELLQNEEDDAVANQGGPIEPSQHVLFFFGRARLSRTSLPDRRGTGHGARAE